MADIKDVDLYRLLELTIDCSEQDIRSAYRKKALKCHPDKNPDDKKAIETFHLLSKAIEILLDKTARDAYDKVIRKKEEVKIRNSKLDNTRKKFKEDLEKREKEYEENKFMQNKLSEEEKLEKEILRLRKEGSIKLQEEIKLMQEELKLKTNLQNESNVNPEEYRIIVKWKFKNNKDKNQDEGEENDKEDSNEQKIIVYNETILNKIFSKYGKINVLVISNKKSKGSALIEFDNIESAKKARLYELGLPNNKLNIKFINNIIENEFVRKNKNLILENEWNFEKMFSDKSHNKNESAESTSNNHSLNSNSKSIFQTDIKSNSESVSNIFEKSKNLFPSLNQNISSSNSMFPSSTNTLDYKNIFPTNSSNTPVFPSVFQQNSRNSNNTSSSDYEQQVLNKMLGKS